MRTAINLYSVRELDESMGEILDRVGAAGYDGVQFSGGFGELSPGEAADEAAARDLVPVPPHLGIDEIESSPEEVIETILDPLGVDGVVIPHLPEAAFESRSAVSDTAARLTGLANQLEPAGFDLHYHNHAHEFKSVNGTTGLEYLIDSTERLKIELDVGWVQTGGKDPVALIETHGHRMPLLHMKDMLDGEFTEIGAGGVDMAGCIAAGQAANTEWLIYENDQPIDPAASIDIGAEELSKLL